MSDVNVTSTKQSGGITAGQVVGSNSTVAIAASVSPASAPLWKRLPVKILVGVAMPVAAAIITALLGFK